MPETPATALISEDGRYRYSLTRTWSDDVQPRRVAFVMLNPSTADAEKPDPTMARCVNFARSWGYGGLVIVNLYALRSPVPALLWKDPDPIGLENELHLFGWVAECALVVCAWGAEPRAQKRAARVLRKLASLGIAPHALKLTKSGAPQHPLYCPASLTPSPMEVPT